MLPLLLGPAPSSAPPSPTAGSGSGSVTHAWMRLAKSLCEELLPGVPRGLWPPEIMPDILREKGLSTQPGHRPRPPRTHRPRGQVRGLPRRDPASLRCLPTQEEETSAPYGECASSTNAQRQG